MRGLSTFFVYLFLFGFLQNSRAEELDNFTADYNVFYGQLKLGEGVYILRQLQNNTYNFSFKSNMRFLIFSDKRRVDVDFNFIDGQVQPIRYTHKRTGTGPDTVDVITFDKVSNKIVSEHEDGTYQQEYDALIRDALSAQLQLILDLEKGVKKPSYIILDDNRVKQRHFEFVDKVTITVSDEEYHCVVYQLTRNKKKKRTKMWFSIEHNYLPVQMIHFDKNKKKFNAELTFFAENEPAKDKKINQAKLNRPMQVK